MRFHLIKDTIPVAIVNDPDNLDFSLLKHCRKWSVWVFWDNDASAKIVDVDWSSGHGYVFYDPYARDRCFIPAHALIVPLIRSALIYNHIFSRYNGPVVAKLITVLPDND